MDPCPHVNVASTSKLPNSQFYHKHRLSQRNTSSRMRSIARQSARRVRAPSQNRHTRCFSQAAPRRAEGRTPTDTPGHRNHVEHRPLHTSDTTRAKEAEREGEATENAPNAKLLKSFRQRRREANSPPVPKPPPIPDFFLRNNVRIYWDELAPNQDAENAQVLRCVDNDTGHTLFTLPYYEAWPVPGMTPTSGKDVKSSTTDAPPSTGIKTPPSEGVYKEVNSHALLRWALLQAELGIEAAFALAKDPPPTSSQATSRVDLSITCESVNSHLHLDEVVDDLANITGSDLIRLDANDFADLSAEYFGQGLDKSGSFGNLAYDVYDGFVSTSGRPTRIQQEEQDEEMEEDEDEQDDEEMSEVPASSGLAGLHGLRTILMASRHQLASALNKVGPTDIIVGGFKPTAKSGNPFASAAEVIEGNEFETARLSALVESLLNSPSKKRTTDFSEAQEKPFQMHLADGSKSRSEKEISNEALWRVRRSSRAYWYPDVAGLLAYRVDRAGIDSKGKLPAKLEAADSEPSKFGETSVNNGPRTIVHLRDLRDLCRNRLGEAIIKRIVSAAQKQRRKGVNIVVVGTSASEPLAFTATPQGLEDFRNIRIPAPFTMSKEDKVLFKPNTTTSSPSHRATRTPYSRILEMNLRNIRAMLRTAQATIDFDISSESAQQQLSSFGPSSISNTVFSFDTVQQIVLTAIGLARTHAQSGAITATHIGLAMLIEHESTRASDFAVRRVDNNQREEFHSRSKIATATNKGPSRLDTIKKDCNPHELRLLPGVVDAENINIGFGQVHAPPETIDALKTMTSLSLLRPDAFKYGVLAADRLPGVLLYGPPGTGKTLLAKAVAKESGATVLEISAAQVFHKFVGEGEKAVQAVFSLAKKFSPCIIFFDEADSLFSSRSEAGSRNTHREVLLQFLKEWDGLRASGHDNVLVMLATNRPFDLDDAVLRRLPRKLLVDLPGANDRESILKIHLADESLDESVNLTKLAEDETALYSGSDLKNMCVSAALACVKEENELAALHKDDKEFKLPEKRVLSSRHFEKALKEISASISEDMRSLAAIRKFDEQFGDRVGRKKKTNYGFGLGDVAVDENAARVRQPTASPP